LLARSGLAGPHVLTKEQYPESGGLFSPLFLQKPGATRIPRSMLNVLVIGSGGREHALCYKLSKSSQVGTVFCAPGNAGIATHATCLQITISEHDALVAAVRERGIGLVVIGPDDALAAGLADHFHAEGIRVFGPTQRAAQLESSKVFAKDFMKRHGIPTARSGSFHNSIEAQAFAQSLPLPVVIKADGLAFGKGVIIAQSRDEAAKTIYRIMERGQFGEAGRRVVIEEFLTGQECSLHALVDGAHYVLLPGAQDHKQIFDGDQGPNTGGMGTISPTPLLDQAMLERVRVEVMDRFLAGLKADGLEFKGLLFPGLMITQDGPQVLEFNCRFGDPETQVLMTRLESDLVELLDATINGTLDRVTPRWSTDTAVCVVMASGGYPGDYEKGTPIMGLNDAGQIDGATVFHAGTSRNDAGTWRTNGGRVLGVTASGATIEAARAAAYDAVRRVSFEGAQFRTDIAAKALSGL